MIKSLIKLNKTIQTGYNNVSWILNVIIGSSLISYIITGLRLISLIPAFMLPIIVTGTYYYIGRVHNKAEETEEADNFDNFKR